MKLSDSIPSINPNEVSRLEYDQYKKAIDISTRSIEVVVTPTIDVSSAYAAGDRMGSTMTIASASRVAGEFAYLTDVQVIDTSKQQTGFDILIFNQQPTIASADNAAISVSTATLANVVGVFTVLSADYVAIATNAVANTKGSGPIGLLPAASGTDLYAVMVIKSAATYTSVSGIKLKFKFLQD